MAINPIQITQPQAWSGGADFSPLSEIGDTIAKAIQERQAAKLIEQLDERMRQQQQQQAAGTSPTQPTAAPPPTTAPLWLQSAAQGNYNPAAPAAAPPAAGAPPAAAPATALAPPDATPQWLQSALAGNYSPAAPQPMIDPRSPAGRMLARLGMGPSPDSPRPAPFPAAGTSPVPGLPPANPERPWYDMERARAIAQNEPPPPTAMPPFPTAGVPPVAPTPERPPVLPPWARNATVGGTPSPGFGTAPPTGTPPVIPSPVIGPDAAPPPAPPAPGYNPPLQAMAQAPAPSQEGLDRALRVIRQKESSGKYDSVTTTRNPRTGQLQSAIGAYGIMDFNVGPWTKEALGREMTPDEFRDNKAAQDAVARYKFGQYAQKYGLTGAARAWLGGPGNMNRGDVADAFGTTPLAYGADFERKMGGLPPEITAGTSRPQEAPARAMALDATQAAAAPAAAAPASSYNRVVQNLTSPQATAADADISSKELAALYRNPITRPIATAFLQKRLDPGTYKFMAAGDNIVRYNERTGQYTMLPMREKPTAVAKGATLVDPNTGKVIYKSGDEQFPEEPPTGFYWKDPKDKSKGLEAIPGGAATQLPAETAAKIGLGESFLNRLPSIKQQIEADKLGIDVSPATHLAAQAGVGSGAELKRQIESGADAILRMMTGAGMGIEESAKYAKRYEVTSRDTKDQLLSKLAQLEDDMHHVSARIYTGHGENPFTKRKRVFAPTGDESAADRFAAAGLGPAPATGPSPGTALQLEVGKAYYGRKYLGGPPGDPKSWGVRVQ